MDFERLSTDVTTLILLECDLLDLLRVTCSNKSFNQIISSDTFWKRKLYHDNPIFQRKEDSDRCMILLLENIKTGRTTWRALTIDFYQGSTKFISINNGSKILGDLVVFKKDYSLGKLMNTISFITNSNNEGLLQFITDKFISPVIDISILSQNDIYVSTEESLKKSLNCQLGFRDITGINISKSVDCRIKVYIERWKKLDDIWFKRETATWGDISNQVLKLEPNAIRVTITDSTTQMIRSLCIACFDNTQFTYLLLGQDVCSLQFLILIDSDKH
jgi:hypothetical protein